MPNGRTGSLKDLQAVDNRIAVWSWPRQRMSLPATGSESTSVINTKIVGLEPRLRPLQSENVLVSWVESPRERGRHDVSATRDQALGSMARTRGTGSIRGSWRYDTAFACLMATLSRSALALLIKEKGGVVRSGKADLVFNAVIEIKVEGSIVEFKLRNPHEN